MSETDWKARVHASGDAPMRVDRVHAPGETPGNVGVCFSGGGSRAMAAAMGQLRGLCRLQVDGRPAFERVRAVATVSGGAWCLAPFTWLNDAVPDEAFFGAWCAPEDLRLYPPRPGFVDQTPRAGSIDDLHPQCVGQVAADGGFSIGGLVTGMIELLRNDAVPAEDVWTVLVARQVLARYGLYTPGADLMPTRLFSSDASTCARLVADNPTLDPAQVHCVAQGAGRIARPFLVIGTGLLVDDGSARRPLAAMHTTPYFTGVLGTPDACDANGRPVGGGGATSFAAVARPRAVDPPDGVRLQPSRPWTLADAVGTSSVWYAETIANTYNEMLADPAAGRARMQALTPAWLTLPETPSDAVLGGMAQVSSLNPRYHTWPVRDPRPVSDPIRDTLADGGSLDNTAITWMLAYADIDHVIAFLNSFNPLAEVALGAFDATGAEIPDSRIVINEHVPPLFGYQPWAEGVGYRLYAGEPAPAKPAFQHNQVFESAAFAPLLRALRAASRAGGAWYTAPTVATVTLRVLENRWHGIRGRGGPGDADPRPIRLTLSYLSRVRRWRDRLTAPVRRVLGDVDDPDSFDSFPHISTGKTEIGARGVCLLAHQTAWCVADPENASIYAAAFAKG